MFTEYADYLRAILSMAVSDDDPKRPHAKFNDYSPFFIFFLYGSDCWKTTNPEAQRLA